MYTVFCFCETCISPPLYNIYLKILTSYRILLFSMFLFVNHTCELLSSLLKIEIKDSFYIQGMILKVCNIKNSFFKYLFYFSKSVNKKKNKEKNVKPCKCEDKQDILTFVINIKKKKKRLYKYF